MKHTVKTPKETYGPALDKARLALRNLDPQQVAASAAVGYKAHGPDSGEFAVPFFGASYVVTWPDGAVQPPDGHGEADITVQILLLHYLLTANGTPMGSSWIAFRNLPGGIGYDAAYRGRANNRLARIFGADQTSFEAAAKAMRGERLSFGDSSFLFRALPRVWLAIVLNLADDEFPADANVLFDSAAEHYLPTEDLAVLGGMLAGRLIRAAQNSQFAQAQPRETPQT
jgi:hypothetical protein